MKVLYHSVAKLAALVALVFLTGCAGLGQFQKQPAPDPEPKVTLHRVYNGNYGEPYAAGGIFLEGEKEGDKYFCRLEWQNYKSPLNARTAPLIQYGVDITTKDGKTPVFGAGEWRIAELRAGKLERRIFMPGGAGIFFYKNCAPHLESFMQGYPQHLLLLSDFRLLMRNQAP